MTEMTSLKFRLAQLCDSCDCQKGAKHELHYISFDETFKRLREVIDECLIYLSSRNDLLKFVIGQTYVNPKKDKEFDFQSHETWSKKGVREELQFLKEKGFNDIVIIGCIEDDLIRNDVCDAMRSPEKYASALRDRLFMHYAYQKPDERLHSDLLQKEHITEEKTESRLIYIAFKFKKEEKKKKKDKKSRSRSSSSSSSKSSSSSSSRESSSSSSDSDSSRQARKSTMKPAVV